MNSSSSTSTFNPQRSRVVHPPLLLNFPELVLLLPTRRSAQPHPETSRLCCGRAGPAGQKYSWILCSLKKKKRKNSPPGGGRAGGTLLGAFNSAPLFLRLQMMAAPAAHPRGSAAVLKDLDFPQLLSGPSEPAVKAPDGPDLQGAGSKPAAGCGC